MFLPRQVPLVEAGCKRLEVLGDLEVKGDAQFSGDVNVDGLLTLNGGVGIREVFRATGSTGWSGGQLLSEAFPDADMKLLEQGTLFVAVLRNTVSYLFGTSSRTVTRREPVLCARVTGSVAGSSIDTISGCAVMFSNISGNYAPRCQHSYQFNIAKSGEDYLLESDYLRIYDATDYTGKTVTLPAVESDGELTNVHDITLNYQDGEKVYKPWHIDVIEDNGKTVLLVMCKSGTDWTLFLSTSDDNSTFTSPKLVMVGNPYGWDTRLYRSSIVNVDGEYRIYYSAQDEGQKYGLGICTSNTLSNFVGNW